MELWLRNCGTYVLDLELSPAQNLSHATDVNASPSLRRIDQDCNISHLTDDGRAEERSLELPLPCKVLSSEHVAQADLDSLEQAAEPENLAQETIIDNLAPQEAARLSRVRNIGIAVRFGTKFGWQDL